MFSPNKNNLLQANSYENPAIQISRHIKQMESRYLSDEYQREMNLKMEKKFQEKQRKKQQLQQSIRNNQQYLNNVMMDRLRKIQQKKNIAEAYDDMINYRKMKEQNEKRHAKSFEKDLLGYKSWLRDKDQERQINKMKVNRYNQELESFVQTREEKNRRDQELQRQTREKLNEQAQRILEKEIQQLQQRQRKKLLFEQRQNQLLGASSRLKDIDNIGSTSLSNSRAMQQNILRKKQQQVYGQGLRVQYQYEKEKQRKQLKQGYNPSQAYNPITNPIPIAYKNPNVLRMLSQK